MSFLVAAASYNRFIGRYSEVIAPRFLDFARMAHGPVLDVGCGPGSLSAVVAERFGAGAAVDPSAPFVAACAARVPGADVRVANGEALPFADGTFGASLSQLVLSFVREPDRFVRELVRVAQPGGIVAACTFEAGGFALVRTFWEAALALDPTAPHDDALPFRREEQLGALWTRSGLGGVEAGRIEVEAAYTDFDDLWRPFAFGIGPAGGWLVAQPPARQEAMRDEVYSRLGRPTGPFVLPARVIAVRGRVR